MKPIDYWNICNSGGYETIGNEVDYKIIIRNNEIILCFQCTKGKLGSVDWKCNFDFPSVVYKNQKSCMKIHRGYVKAWQSARDDIMVRMKSLILVEPEYRVTVVGHSLGGAMALLAAEDLSYSCEFLPTVATFGAPKICANSETAHYIDNMCYITQYVNRSDIVPKVVPTYWHAHKTKIGTFNLKDLFNPTFSHTCYGLLLQGLI